MLVLTWLYFIAVAILMLFGSHRTYMALRQVLSQESKSPPFFPSTLPPVCVQLPLFNEANVAERLIEAVSELTYPREKLEIQILDDSTDNTQEITRELCKKYSEQGFFISVIHRAIRQDYKAGALRNGLRYTDAPVIAVFDADFVPAPDFLLKTVPYFQRPQVGFVQVRWAYLNRFQNLLTRAQAVLLDGHFFVEHSHRFSSGAFFNFNGTAGLWRREAIERSGNWQGDTITEDLDLSYRAQLSGWKGVYLCEYSCESELPARAIDFKSQQYRWTKGSAQVLRKLLLPILLSSTSVRVKCEALIHLSSSFCYLLGVLVAILLAPVAAWRSQTGFFFGPWFELLIFLFTFGSLSSFYMSGQSLSGKRFQWWRSGEDDRTFTPFDIVSAIVLGVGISVTCAGAVLSGLGKAAGEFVRTPKSGSTGESSWHSSQVNSWLDTFWSGHFFGRGCRREMFMCLYLVLALVYTLTTYHFLSAPFLVLMLVAYLLVVAKVKREQTS